MSVTLTSCAETRAPTEWLLHSKRCAYRFHLKPCYRKTHRAPQASLQGETVTRPCYPRAGSSSSSGGSFDFRNPFADDGELHHLSTSQLDLTQPLDSTAFQPPMSNASIRNVARGSPTIVHPPSEHPGLFYHVVTEDHGTTDPFADESEVTELAKESPPESTVREVSIQVVIGDSINSYELEYVGRARQTKATKQQLDRRLSKACGPPSCQHPSHSVHPATRRRTS